MFSFPDHFSQTSERTIKDNPQLDVDTHVFVDDLIRTAEEKYQRVRKKEDFFIESNENVSSIDFTNERQRRFT